MSEIERGAEIEYAAALLRSGKLVAFPTETVYGLGANALDPAAVAGIFDAKGRPRSSPLIVHVATVAMARDLAASWPAEAEKVAGAFWPGPLTIVVPKKDTVPALVTAGLPSVGIRMPAHPLARALLLAAGVPVAAPSANRFTRLSPTTAAHVRAAFPDIFVLDGGPSRVGIESTVLSFAGDKPRILRPGMVTQPQIEAVIGRVETGPGAESPGQHPRHYSPRTRIILGDPPKQGRGAYLSRAAMPPDPARYAEDLYATLHELDRRNLDWIAIELPPETPAWAGIRDRIIRAAADAGS